MSFFQADDGVLCVGTSPSDTHLVRWVTQLRSKGARGGIGAAVGGGGGGGGGGSSTPEYASLHMTTEEFKQASLISMYLAIPSGCNEIPKSIVDARRGLLVAMGRMNAAAHDGWDYSAGIGLLTDLLARLRMRSLLGKKQAKISKQIRFMREGGVLVFTAPLSEEVLSSLPFGYWPFQVSVGLHGRPEFSSEDELTTKVFWTLSGYVQITKRFEEALANANADTRSEATTATPTHDDIFAFGSIGRGHDGHLGFGSQPRVVADETRMLAALRLELMQRTSKPVVTRTEGSALDLGVGSDLSTAGGHVIKSLFVLYRQEREIDTGMGAGGGGSVQMPMPSGMVGHSGFMPQAHHTVHHQGTHHHHHGGEAAVTMAAHVSEVDVAGTVGGGGGGSGALHVLGVPASVPMPMPMPAAVGGGSGGLAELGGGAHVMDAAFEGLTTSSGLLAAGASDDAGGKVGKDDSDSDGNDSDSGAKGEGGEEDNVHTAANLVNTAAAAGVTAAVAAVGTKNTKSFQPAGGRLVRGVRIGNN